VRRGEDAIKDYSKDQTVKVKVLDVDVEKERISLGIKQLSEDPFAGAVESVKKGEVMTVTVSSVQDAGIEVKLGDGALGFIRKSDLSRERSEQRPDRFAVGEKVDAKITNIDKKTRRITLSIKAREMDEEKKAVAEYGSTESGASLGDILGAAFSKAQAEREGKKKRGKAKDEDAKSDEDEDETEAED
jgi:small subunit ribosomal protein S1